MFYNFLILTLLLSLGLKANTLDVETKIFNEFVSGCMGQVGGNQVQSRIFKVAKISSSSDLYNKSQKVAQELLHSTKLENVDLESPMADIDPKIIHSVPLNQPWQLFVDSNPCHFQMKQIASQDSMSGVDSESDATNGWGLFLIYQRVIDGSVYLFVMTSFSP